MATSANWPRLESDILSCMPPQAEARIFSGELLSRVQAKYGEQAPGRDTVIRALDRLCEEGLVGKEGRSRDKKWWRTGKKAVSGTARRPPLELAIALLTLQRHAPNHLPSHVISQLEDYFVGAARVLQESPVDPALATARAWAAKTVRIDAGYPLRSPPIREDILNAVRRALYATQVLSVCYRNSRLDSEEPAAFNVVPLALVERGPVLYLVASRERSDGSFKRYQLRLDRFVQATCTEVAGRADPDFDLDAYVLHNQFFSFFPEAPVRVELRVREDGEIKNLFREQKLADDQEIVEEEGGFRLTATVIPSVEFRNLLMERSARVEILSPAHLRREIAGNLSQACRAYADALASGAPEASGT
ncbi:MULTISPECIES: helix-turn-helix transcriptional regulator [Cupriavidus]|uniref:helix-turn-helix transcriptional regulator n=1 Tax=Cupriavidus sp. WS TaxID=1312922 RepID=UPI00037C2321|nr:WYL domain-containing protein [Cupriavidus sp. WS]